MTSPSKRNLTETSLSIQESDQNQDRDQFQSSKRQKTEPSSTSTSHPISNTSITTSTTYTPSMSTFNATLQRSTVFELSKKKAPSFQKPLEIASFSYDEQRRLFHDDRSLTEYHEPFPKDRNGVIDLNRGIEDWVTRDEEVNEHLDSLLFALMNKANQSYSTSSDQHQGAPSDFNEEQDRDRSRANLITWRGMMTRLFTCLYENQQGFEMNVMMVGDTIYIEEHVDKQSLEKKQKQMADVKQRKFTFYGYNFESWCTHQPQNQPPRKGIDDSWSGSPNTNVQWCSIVKTSLGNKRMILGGEVDCLKPKPKKNPYDSTSLQEKETMQRERGEMVELKTSMTIKNQRDEERFEIKMLRFYTQSFLLGIPYIVVGFRDYQGRLQSIQEFKTLEMPRLVRGKPHEWDPLTCLSFAETILEFLQTNLKQEHDNSSTTTGSSLASSSTSVYRLSFKSPFQQLDLRVLSEEEVLTEVQGGDRNQGGIERIGLLPKVYYDFATRKRS